MGFIGCGSRGKSVIGRMSENTNINIIALADIFEDRLNDGVSAVNALNRKKGYAAVSRNNLHRGSGAYLKLLENRDVDAVLISTPAYSHPDIVEAAVNAGKHVYCEKPAAIDVDGCKQVIRTGENINGKLSAVTGFQIRHASSYAEMANRIRRGDIGEIITVQLYYLSSGLPITPCGGMSHDECRIRNHFHFRELSGGIFLDQAIHMIDVCNWVLGSTPLYAFGLGGDGGRAGFGNSWTNYQVIYKYPGDINVSVHSSQLGKLSGGVCARFVGTKGIAEAHYSGGVFIRGENEWDSGIIRSNVNLSPEDIARGAQTSSLYDADRNKGKSFIGSIESGKYLNELRSGSNSTLSAILGREAAAKQEKVTWDEISLNSQRIETNLNLKQFET